MTRMVWVLMLGALFAVAGCERKAGESEHRKVTPEDVKKDVGKAADTVSEFSEQKRDEFLKKLDSQIGDLDAKIAKLKDQGADLSGDAKEKWDKKVDELAARSTEMKEKLKKAKEQTGAAWNDFQKSVQATWDDLDKSFKDTEENK